MAQAYAVADVIADLVSVESGDGARWLEAHTSRSKMTWSRTLKHERVIDYKDISEAAEALGTSVLTLIENAQGRLNVGGDSDASVRDVIPLDTRRKGPARTRPVAARKGKKDPTEQ